MPGGPPGLQNRWAARRVAGGFDSRPPPLGWGNAAGGGASVGGLACPAASQGHELEHKWNTHSRSRPVHQCGDRLGRCPVRLRLDVGVVRCHRRVGVPEGLPPDLRVHSGVPRQAGRAVPASCNLIGTRGCPVGYCPEPAAHVVRLPRRAIGLAEDQVMILPCGTRLHPRPELGGAVLAQQGSGPGVQPDRPPRRPLTGNAKWRTGPTSPAVSPVRRGAARLCPDRRPQAGQPAGPGEAR